MHAVVRATLLEVSRPATTVTTTVNFKNEFIIVPAEIKDMQIVNNRQSEAAASYSSMMNGVSSLPLRSNIMSPYLNGHLNGHPRALEPSVSPSLSNRSSGEGDDKHDKYMGSPDKPFKCSLCSTVLDSQSAYTAHIRGHNEVKPHTDPNDPTGQAKVYYCCICNKMLSSFSSLDRHMLVHSGERPFSCELCGQTFTTNGNMHRHKRTHGTRDSHESDVSSGASSAGPRRPGRKRKVSIDQGNVTAAQHALVNGRFGRGLFGEDMLPVSAVQSTISRYPADFLALKAAAAAHTMHIDRLRETAKATPLEQFRCGEVTTLTCEACGHVERSFYALTLHKHIYHNRSGASFPDMGLESQPVSPISSLNGTKKEPIPTKEEVMDLSPVKALTPRSEDYSQHSSDAYPAREHTPRSHHDSNSMDNHENNMDESEGMLREMKLKGEFPCRICPAVYPNLRALKGHNKEHLDKPPYSCNVANCIYSSHDKGTLTRHMRAHTGEKPYECKECNFGFTTKANCERHVKNKHGKSDRSSIRDSIAIHEVNDENTGDESLSPGKLSVKLEGPKRGSKPALFAPYHSAMFRNMTEEPQESEPEQKRVKLDKAESPLDYSMSNLADPPKPTVETEASTYEPKPPTPTLSPAFPVGALSGPMALPILFQQMVAAQMAQAKYANMSHPMDNPAFLAAQSEMLRRQAIVSASIQQKDPATAAYLLHYINQFQSGIPMKPVVPVVVPPKPESFAPALFKDNPANKYPEKPPKSSADPNNEFKMIIKNGVLMRKQKQKRYRTERPYGCELCKARFTLRSNMERHVKQQHPEHWNKFKLTIGLQEAELEVVDGDGDEEEEEQDEEEEEEETLSEDERIDVDGDDLPTEDMGSDGDPSSPKPFDEQPGLDEEEEEEEEEGQVAPDSDCEMGERKSGSAYTNSPHKLHCPHCDRVFPWASSLNRHILTHTGAKPFKCERCVLLFTTKSNCDRHLLRKHSNHNNNYEKQTVVDGSSSMLNGDTTKDQPEGEHDTSKESVSSDCPFKCHLCEASFPDRSEAIAHLKLAHTQEFDQLNQKGAFELSHDLAPHHSHDEHNEETFDQLRGKFPDYVNRKVICLFCLRKFWSAEDLRRHVRTHTGDRPFSCDICQRRFSLKHSMLRHRRKHDSGVSSGNDEGSESETDSRANSSPNSTSSSGTGAKSSPDLKPVSGLDKPKADIVEEGKKPEQDEKKRANLMNAILKLSMQGSE